MGKELVGRLNPESKDAPRVKLVWKPREPCMLSTALGLLEVHKTPTGSLGIPALKLMEALECP